MRSNSENWPAGPILFWGSFGALTPEGRRFHNHFKICLMIMLTGVLSGTFWPTAWGRALAAILPGLAFSGIAWSIRRYLLSLDELARRIQVESIAWTYLTGLAVVPLVAGIMVAFDVHPNFIQGIFGPSNPFSRGVELFLPYCYVLLLEQIRTLWLYRVSRKY